MARPKQDSRLRRRRRRQTAARNNRTKYNNYSGVGKIILKNALNRIRLTGNISDASRKWSIPRQTLSMAWNSMGDEDVTTYIETRRSRLTLLSDEEEKAVIQYAIWESERGRNLNNTEIKALIREIHQRALDGGAKRQSNISPTGPSAKYMRSFYKRHPTLADRMAERVDRGRINMANQETIDSYFNLLRESMIKNGIMEVDGHGEIIQDTIKKERIYIADEKGWGGQTKTRKVKAKKGAKHVHDRKVSDESHKTLMLGVCGNGDVLKPLVILEKNFPLIGEREGEHLPENILLSKTKKGSMEQDLFVEWLKYDVIPHKQRVNPDGKSLIVLDNHGSRFSTRAIDLCIENKLEFLCYPGHLTHILQGPDVVLNKPISSRVDQWISNNIRISGNSNLSRVAFIACINEAVKEVCTSENIAMSFSATGIIPFNPKIVNLKDYTSSLSNSDKIPELPIKATCTTCYARNVELHPLVRQGVIPKAVAAAFVYTPPPEKTKSKSKLVKNARIVTSESVRAEVAETEKRKAKKLVFSDLVRGMKSKSGSYKCKAVKEESSDTEDSDEDGTDDEEEMQIAEARESIRNTWKSLSPAVISEKDLVGKFYATIYYKGTKGMLYIGKVVRRFLEEKEGNVTQLEIMCLKPKIGHGTIVEDTPLHSKYTEIVDIINIFAGPLTAEAMKGNKFNFPNYPKIEQLFHTVVNVDRSIWLKL